MKHTIYNTTFHLVEIENKKSVGNIGTTTEVWKWEITIADKGEVYKGKAVVPGRKVELPWIQILGLQPLEKMINMCKKYMGNK